MAFRNRKWVFGTNCGLNFSGPVTPFSFVPINTIEGCASISDATIGNLVLYSDGTTIFDAAGNIRAAGLLGNQNSTQAAVVVPDPASPTQYYVFTSDGASGTNNHVSCYHINTVPWGPAITVPLTAPTVTYSPTEKLVAIAHANQNAFWVLTIVQPGTPLANGTGPGVLRVFLVTTTGVAWVGDQSLGQNTSDVGYMKASPKGKRIAIANFWLAKIIVIPFSNSSGMISGPAVTIPTTPVPAPHNSMAPYGVEFSQTGELLYYTTLYPLNITSSPTTDSLLYQFSFPSGAPVLIGAHPRSFPTGSGDASALQYGSDGRIYIAQNGDQKIGVIANPNVAGPGCGLTFSALPLATGSTCRSGLPNLVRELF